MSEIGGYFGLELKNGKNNYHDTPYNFKSGRSALHYALNWLQPSLVYIPYYTCNGLIEPFEVAGVKYEFYKINDQLEPLSLPELEPGQFFLYINYLDIKRKKVDELSALYGDRLIVDSTQAFFMKGNGRSWFFNSCRKFFGVPDGSFLYAPAGQQPPSVSTQNENYKVDHLLKRFNGHTREGYSSFCQNELLLGTEITGMSKFSEYLLSNLNFEQIADTRCYNYRYLHNAFKTFNLMDAEPDEQGVYMFYPLLLPKEIDRSVLFDENIFIPTFWSDVLNRENEDFEFEKKISRTLFPLPVDQRYSVDDMQQIINRIKEILK